MLQTSQTTPKHLSSVKKSSIKHSGASHPENSIPSPESTPTSSRQPAAPLTSQLGKAWENSLWPSRPRLLRTTQTQQRRLCRIQDTPPAKRTRRTSGRRKTARPNHSHNSKKMPKASSATTTSTGSRPNTTPPSFVPGTPYNGGNSDGKKKPTPTSNGFPAWQPSPREAHKIFYHRIWAQDDPFWNSHRPGEVWGCKCGLRSTSRPVTDGNPQSGETVKPSPGLDNNPAVDAKLFADSHPYITLADRNAKKAVKKIHRRKRQTAGRIQGEKIQKRGRTPDTATRQTK